MVFIQHNSIDYKRESASSPLLISLADYDEKALDDLASIAFFCKHKEAGNTLTISDFGPFTRKRYEGAQEESFLQFTDKSILIALLYGEHHYSEDTMDSASIIYYGLTPKKVT